MKFQITSSTWYLSEVLDKYPCLKNYSFEWDKRDSVLTPGVKRQYGIITVKSMDELMKLVEECEAPLIISRDPDEIEIYDGYRE